MGGGAGSAARSNRLGAECRMLADLIAWWVRQMLALLPPRWRTRDDLPRTALVIDCGVAALPVTAACFLRVRRRETVLGSLPLADDAPPPPGWRLPDQKAVVLRLAVAPLECEVMVPLGAEPELARVLQAEMDRLTPFSAADVFWTTSVSQREPAQGRLRALLSVIPRAPLEPLLHALERRGVAPTMMESIRPDGIVRRFPLRPARPQGRLVPMLAGAAATLVLAGALSIPFLLQEREAEILQRRIADLKPTVERVQALRRRVVTGSVDVEAVRAERSRVGDAMQVLATLTDLLPDDTFITALGLRQRRLTISGQSAAAAGLIATLSTATLIRNPVFAAPVVRDPAGRTDNFSLTAEVHP
jgi:general secretion pathway protein L